MPWGLIILLGAGLVVGWLMLVLYTAYLLTHPPRRGYAYAVARGVPGDPSELVLPDPARPNMLVRGLPFESWTFRSHGRDLPVWDIRGLRAQGPVIIITHGWGDSRVVMLSRVAALAPIASRLIVWDLPGHGDAPKSPRGGFTLGAREHEDLLVLIERVVGHGPRAAGSTVVLYGASLGAGSSIVAAAEPDLRSVSPHIDAVIAEAPYRVPAVPARNVFRVRAMPYRTNILPAIALVGARFGYGLSWALSTRAGGFDRAEHAARLSPLTRLLVLHGSDDPVCPVEDGRAIAAAAPSGKLCVIEGASHNNLWTDGRFVPVCIEAVRRRLGEPANNPACPTPSR